MIDQLIKQTEGKIPLGNLLDFKNGLRQVSKVREFGNNKYPNKHSYKDIPEHLLIDATIRHLFADCDEDIDKESKESHLAHAVVNLLMILEQRQIKVTKTDDVKDMYRC